MIKVKGKAITMTRGDTLSLRLHLTLDGEDYAPVAGDVIRFAVKHAAMNDERSEYTDTEPLILKEIPTDTMVLRLDPADTKELGFGTYVFDIQMTYADGAVDTFLPEGLLKLTPEVD